MEERAELGVVTSRHGVVGGPTSRMTSERAMEILREFGRQRVPEGDEFDESRFVSGHFFYTTGDARTSIVVWGGDTWTISVFSCARVRMRPTLELYRYVSRWRTTCGLGAPYVVESDGDAAVVFEQTIGGQALYDDATAHRLLVTTIDVVGQTAAIMARDLAGADGMAFTARGEAGLVLQLSWWEERDERISRLIGLS